MIKKKQEVKNPRGRPKKIEEKKDIPQFVPRSEKQRMILTDMETDVLLCGGGKHAVPPL